MLEQHFLVLIEAYNLGKMLLAVRTPVYIDVFLFHGHFELIDISVKKHVTTKGSVLFGHFPPEWRHFSSWLWYIHEHKCNIIRPLQLVKKKKDENKVLHSSFVLMKLWIINFCLHHKLERTAFVTNKLLHKPL